MWTGRQGKENGLVDEYGGLDRAIEIAKQLAKIPAGQGVQRVIMPKPPSFFDQLMSGGDGDADAQASPELKQQQSILAALPEDVRRAFRYAQMLDRARHGESMYLLPFDLRIK